MVVRASVMVVNRSLFGYEWLSMGCDQMVNGALYVRVDHHLMPSAVSEIIVLHEICYYLLRDT